MSRYKLIISYDGTRYSGWQVQTNGVAIQPLIQKALSTILRHPVDLTGSGRTDAGVHALAQVAHFDTPIPLSPSFLVSLNALLPSDIQVLEFHPTKEDFHARYSATSKIYHYHLRLGPIANPFTQIYEHQVFGRFDLDLVKKAIPYFLGTHDFTSFTHEAHRGSASRDPIRTLQRLDLIENNEAVRLEFEADGFLYKMVRNIVGTLYDVGKKKQDPHAIPAIFASKDRKKAGTCAPPQGLFLVEVKYN